MLHEHLRRKFILLFLDGMSFNYQLSPSCLMYYLKLVFPYLFSFWMICPLVKVGCQSPLLWLCYCWFPLLWLLAFALCIEVPPVGCINIYNCYIFFLDWSLDHYVVSFFVSCHSLYFILMSILSDMRIATPAFFWYPLVWNIFVHPLSSVCMCLWVWSGSLVDSIYMGLVFVSIQPVYVFWLEHLIHLHLR